MLWRTAREAKALIDKCRQDNIGAYAAQSAFFLIISLIPFLMMCSSLLQYTPVLESTLTQLVEDFMPEYIAPFLISIIEEVYHESFGIVSVSTVAAIWSAAKGTQYLATGLNAVNGVEETRNWIVLRFWAVVYTAVFLVAVVASLVLLVFGNSIQGLLTRYVPLIAHALDLFFRLRSLIALAVMVCLFTVLYRTLPNNREIRGRRLTLRNQLPGAVLCAVAWYVFSFGVSVYVDYFHGFSMYGSLTTIVLVMLWVYFGIYIMMVCGEVNVMFGELIERKIRMRGQGGGRKLRL